MHGVPWVTSTLVQGSTATKKLKNTAPQAVAGLPSRQRLRLSLTLALAVPLTRLSMIGDRAFPVTAAIKVTFSKCLWTFKTKLKTHLFSSSFPVLIVKWLWYHRHFFHSKFHSNKLPQPWGLWVLHLIFRRIKNCHFSVLHIKSYQSVSRSWLLFGTWLLFVVLR